jgi:outer membrane usher protein
MDRITFSSPLKFDPRSSLSTSFFHGVNALGTISEILSETYTRSLPYNSNLFATVFRDFGTSRNTGVFVGLTMSLDNSVTVSSYANKGAGSKTGTVDAIKTMGQEPGSYGWHVQDAEGSSPSRAASVSYRSSVGMVQGTVSQNQSGTDVSAELRGSIITMGGGVFLSNWVDQSFAVVDVGAPGVEVLNENRSMGVTDNNGRLLLPNLRSYQNNKVSLNPNNLPVDAALETTREFVTPADRAGALLKFKVLNETTSALVTFVEPDGSFVPAGANGHIEGGGDFIVGYDGQAFIKDLAASNHATIELSDSTCQANFEFTPRPGEQVQIPGVACR